MLVYNANRLKYVPLIRSLRRTLLLDIVHRKLLENETFL